MRMSTLSALRVAAVLPKANERFTFLFFIATVCVANKDVNTAAKIHISACYQLAISSKASPISTAS